MKAQTFSILAGSVACNARCPFCVSKMTPSRGIRLKEPGVNWEKFKRAAAYAREHGTETAMITGKGEPTLFPKQITKYLDVMSGFGFRHIELQTNGIRIADEPNVYEQHLSDWYERGLDLIAISIVHYDAERNRQIYLPYRKNYIDLPSLVENLNDRKRKFKVRLACIALDGFIDSSSRLADLIEFARKNGAEQLTVRPVNKTDRVDNGDPEVEKAAVFINKYHLKDGQIDDMRNYLARNGRHIRELHYGATIYDVNGRSVCLTNSLTRDLNPNYLRQLIFFPEGRLLTDWQYEGEVPL
ncbi:MAG: radical SAM protein [Candidatus Aenigmarchaeota archaeon]|nr:radical SAM protein [Candidatus Aenigmarchaeota archaeon]